VTFEGAKAVLGVRSLEDLGLKVNPVSSSLEAARPAGIAHNSPCSRAALTLQPSFEAAVPPHRLV
jgi:hypothetical protein